MKRISLIVTFILLLTLIVTGCSGRASNTTANKQVLKVGASVTPHAEILAFIKPMLAKEGVDLQIIEIHDFVGPNLALAEKELDANYFQHIPYLTKFSAERSLPLTYTAAVHIEPMGIYSKKIKNLSELPNGAKVSIPNEATNGGRALALLAKAGLIKLKDGIGVNATVHDIVENHKGLKIIELEAAQLPRTLDDVVISVITTNYALEANLVPAKDALFFEQKESPFVNVLAIRKGDENRPEIQKLTKALTSEEVRKFIIEKYQGAVVPAF